MSELNAKTIVPENKKDVDSKQDQQQKQPQQKQKAQIVVTSNEQFKGGVECMFVTTDEVCDLVSTLFSGVFTDYYGCRVYVNDGTNGIAANVNNRPVVINPNNLCAPGAMCVDLYFKKSSHKAEGMIENLSESDYVKAQNAVNGMNDLAGRLSRDFLNGNNPCRAYNVTDSTYEALEEFVPYGYAPSWNLRTKEIDVGRDWSRQTRDILTCISNLSLDRILTKIYGWRDEESQYEYMAEIAALVPGKMDERVLRITRLDRRTVRRLESILGANVCRPVDIHVSQKYV